MPRSGLRRFFRHGTFPQLMVFEAVARLGSVTRAAEELHLAQPTVSTQLKKLAQSLDVALFEQEGRGLRLTAAGRELQAACGELFEVIAHMEGRLAALRGPPSAAGAAPCRTWRFAPEPILDGLGVDANNPPASSTGGNSATIERRP